MTIKFGNANSDDEYSAEVTIPVFGQFSGQDWLTSVTQVELVPRVSNRQMAFIFMFVGAACVLVSLALVRLVREGIPGRGAPAVCGSREDRQTAQAD